MPPAASMRSRAVFENLWACTVSFLSSSPRPRILTGTSRLRWPGRPRAARRDRRRRRRRSAPRGRPGSRAACASGTARTASTSSCSGRAACASACGSGSGRPRSARGPWRRRASRSPCGRARTSCRGRSRGRGRRACGRLARARGRLEVVQADRLGLELLVDGVLLGAHRLLLNDRRGDGRRGPCRAAAASPAARRSCRCRAGRASAACRAGGRWCRWRTRPG